MKWLGVSLDQLDAMPQSYYDEAIAMISEESARIQAITDSNS